MDAISPVVARAPAPIQAIRALNKRDRSEQETRADEAQQAEDKRRAADIAKNRDVREIRDVRRSADLRRAAEERRNQRAIQEEVKRQPPPLRPAPAPGTGTIFDIDA